jgi:hypothetical protein
MNYTLIYEKLISYNRINPPIGYTEKHHIIPKCMGGSNETSNMIILSARAHYVAHRLLVKIHPEQRKLKYALWRLTHDKRRTVHIDSRSYAKLREQISYDCRERFRGQKYTEARRMRQSMALKGRKQSPESIERRRIANTGSKRTPQTKEHLRNAWAERKSSGNVKIWNTGLRYKTGPKPNMRGVQTSTKLTSQQVSYIRELYDKKLPIAGVGEIQRNGVRMSYLQAFCKLHSVEYNVSTQCLKLIILRKSWPDGIKAKR